ncbi:MDR family oxidoreductase [Hahella ganghwensis]|uniref:acrylyl-CoA reductase (NADPH) n=1 Tax=Hahella ganghwensis TaxID=286420 RepID=UPI00037B0795|nr:MDR family oxidoreductase [Hahella ganghwensis]
MFRGLLINKDDDTYSAGLADIDEASLPEGEVTVDVEYSTLNYKDGLAITGKSPVVRKFPMVAGIDFVGTVSDSQSDEFKVGDKVLLNGWGVGEVHWGGLAQKAKVPAKWLFQVPEGMASRQTMIIGTAGYTAMLCVQALEEQGVMPDAGEILVTGAAGGVGSIALFLLAQRGYSVVASTGRVESETAYLKSLGATEVMDRSVLSEPGRPLGKERWAGAVDVAGSHTLANVCATTRYGGVVTACGLAQGMDFPASVAPFILRGVRLIGVDSVYCPMPKRLRAWEALSQEWKAERLGELVEEIGLSEVVEYGEKILSGKVRGRLLVDVNR